MMKYKVGDEVLVKVRTRKYYGMDPMERRLGDQS